MRAVTVINLWDGAPPGTESWTHAELAPERFGDPEVTIVRNVVVPTLIEHAPPEGWGSGVAAIVAPGGAYHFLALEHEGHDVARWLVARGVTAYVLKYRVVPTPVDDAGFKAALAALWSDGGLDRVTREMVPHLRTDGARAIEVVRARGAERVVMIGFSAGARLTTETLLAGEQRLDGAAQIYAPWVDVDVAPADAPPLFVLAADDDPLGTTGSTTAYAAWRKAKRPVELHLFERGGHGFGMLDGDLPVNGWIDLLGGWLRSHELLGP
jgi:acetyl esterase/lipase